MSNKAGFWVGRNSGHIFAVCGPKFTEFGACKEVVAVCEAVLRLTRSSSSPEICAIKSQNHVVENLVFWLKNFRGEGPPKFDAEIFISRWGHIMWTSSVQFSQRTPTI